MYDTTTIVKHVRRMRTDHRAVARDSRMMMMRLVRANQLDLIASDVFSEAWPKPLVANFINTAAMDMAESLAPLPALNCASGSMTSSTAKDKATLRTKIGHHYWEKSNLKKHSVNGADWYFSYGFLPILVEPCFETNMPKLRFEDPYMSYPDIDRYGRCHRFVKVMMVQAATLGALFPELESQLCYDSLGRPRYDVELEVIRYTDKHCTVMYVEDEGQGGKTRTTVLSEVENLLGVCPVAVAVRPTLDGEIRGQYDDAIWPQIARGKMMSLALEAGVKAVEAPIAVPQDLVEMPIGPDSIWRTESPEKIRRVSMEIPNSAWQMDDKLEKEQMRATRSNEARSGSISASVITGRGVDSLMGGFDTLIKSAQDQLGAALGEATSIAFMMDEKMFGDVQKRIIGTSAGAGAPYDVKYTAKNAIKGDYSCETTYGLLAGLAPNNAVILALQLLGAGLISKEMVQKNLPFDVDTTAMAQAITIERTRDAILEGVSALSQTIPSAAQMGQDPRMVVSQMAAFVAAVGKGESIEDAALKAFAPPEPPPGAPAPEGDQMLAEAAAAQGAMGGGMAPPGMDQGPQALPDIMSMMNSFRGGKAEMSVSQKRNTLI